MDRELADWRPVVRVEISVPAVEAVMGGRSGQTRTVIETERDTVATGIAQCRRSKQQYQRKRYEIPSGVFHFGSPWWCVVPGSPYITSTPPENQPPLQAAN
jgi:hypothetical protein